MFSQGGIWGGSLIPSMATSCRRHRVRKRSNVRRHHTIPSPVRKNCSLLINFGKIAISKVTIFLIIACSGFANCSLVHIHIAIEENSPFFGIFADDDMQVFLEIRDEYKAPVEHIEEIHLPFRGDPWNLKKHSVWAERIRNSDARDFWDNDTVHTNAFNKVNQDFSQESRCSP